MQWRDVCGITEQPVALCEAVLNSSVQWRDVCGITEQPVGSCEAVLN